MKKVEEKLQKEFPSHQIRLEENKEYFNIFYDEKKLKVRINNFAKTKQHLLDNHNVDIEDVVFEMVVNEIRKETK